MKLIIPKKKYARILVVGVGGTGGHLVPNLFRLAYSLANKKEQQRIINIILADGDRVEKKNLFRQNFIEKDLDQNKAEILSKRYGAAYGVETSYIPDYIENEDIILEILKQTKEEKFLPILISCVDNNSSRQMFHRVFQKLDEIFYIDSGNGEFTGQVVCGYKRKGEVVLPPVGELYPDMLEVNAEEDKFRSEQSCGAVIVSSPQNMMANVMAATVIMGFVNDIVAVGTLEVGAVTFSAYSINCRSRFIAV